MRQLEDFKDIHKDEEIIVVCNGPGLKNIPFAFLESRTNFVINFFSGWVPFIRPDYWVVLDPLCFRGAKYVNGTVKFIKGHQAQEFEGECIKQGIEFDEENVCFYQMRDRIPNFVFTEEWGVKYSTSAIAASHLAKYMGASKVLLVGFDCTYGMGLYSDINNFEGVSRIPHFYDPRHHFTGYSEMWDVHFKDFSDWAITEGMEVVNLSIPTKSKLLPRADYRDFWTPEGAYDGR
jgi:hypothetical protein